MIRQHPHGAQPSSSSFCSCFYTLPRTNGDGSLDKKQGEAQNSKVGKHAEEAAV